MPSKSRNIVVKAVTFVLFGLLILSFAVWGIGDIFRGTGQSQAVAEVGDVQIQEPEMARALSRELNRLSAQLGERVDIEQARALGVVDQVLNRIISRALFDQKADDLGLVVTDDQILRRIQQEPAFQNELGQFDRNRFIQVLQVSNLSEDEYVRSLRRDIVRQQVANAVTEAAPAPRVLAEALYRYREERRIAQTILVPKNSIVELPEPDEAALKAFHKEFADSFMNPELRSVTLVRLRADDLAQEVAVSEERLREEYEARREDFITPEQRSLQQIIVFEESKAEEAAAKLAEGIGFEELSQELVGEPPIDVGRVGRDDLLPALAEAAFALEKDAVSQPIESELGWHILRVSDVHPRQEATFAEIRDELQADVAMREAIDSMISIANQLDDELAAGARLEDAAASLNLPVQRIEAIDRQGRDADGEPIPDLPGDRFLDIVFETQVGEQSLLVETDAGGYFVLRVDGMTPAQVKPLDEVRDQVVELWRDGQRAKLAREKAVALAERLSAGADFERVAREEGLTVRTSEPITRFETDPERALSSALPSKLFQMKVGDVSTVNAPAGHMVVKLTEVMPAKPAENTDQVTQVQDNLTRSLQGDILDQFMATLRGEYGVKVNERLLQNMLASF